MLTLQPFSVRRKRLHLLFQRAHLTPWARLPGAGAVTEASHLIPGSWVSRLWALSTPSLRSGPRTCRDMVPLTATTTDSFLWSRATKKGSSYTWAREDGGQHRRPRPPGTRSSAGAGAGGHPRAVGAADTRGQCLCLGGGHASQPAQPHLPGSPREGLYMLAVWGRLKRAPRAYMSLLRKTAFFKPIGSVTGDHGAAVITGGSRHPHQAEPSLTGDVRTHPRALISVAWYEMLPHPR